MQCDAQKLSQSSSQFRLIDSGSQISVTKRLPGDKIDPSLRLIAVNGTKIETFGVRDINLKIGRKSYEFNAIKSEVDNPVLGWDFMRKHRLDVIWNE